MEEEVAMEEAEVMEAEATEDESLCLSICY